MQERGRRTLIALFMCVFVTFAMAFTLIPAWAMPDDDSGVQSTVNGDSGSNEAKTLEELIIAVENWNANKDAEGLEAPTASDALATAKEQNYNLTFKDSEGVDVTDKVKGASGESELLNVAIAKIEVTKDEQSGEVTDVAITLDYADANDEGSENQEGFADLSAETGGQPHVMYSTHVQRKGWTGYVKDGEEAGSTGSSLRMEAMKIKLDMADSGLSGNIQYRVHAQKKGWMGWVSNDQLGGTEGQGLRLEAIQINLTGAIANEYDVYYSVHAQKRGWMEWAKNGDSAGTAGQSLRLEAIKVVLVKKGEGKPDSSFVQYGSAFDGGSIIKLQGHSQKVGWQGVQGNGGVAGTTGRGLRLEAINLTGSGFDRPGTILLNGHVQGIGWTGYKTGSAGTTGRGKRLEAVKIKLTDEMELAYDIYYRAHVAHIGWLNWAKNGEEAGTAGMACRTEAIQVQVVPKGQKPSDSGSVTSEAYLTGTNVGYNPYCQTYGWRGESWNGAVAGTTGQGKRVEALTVRLSGGNIGGGISYRVYVAGSGWQAWKSNGQEAGTTGQSRAIEAVQVSLSGRAAKMYNVYYRTHTQKAGWLGWAANGQTAGAPGTGKRVEAVQIKLVPKGQAAPGSTANASVGKAYFDDPMIQKAQGYSSPTGWLILVDDNRTLLGVFRGSQGNWQKHDMWMISCGAPTSPSKHGVFSVGGRGYAFGHGYTCYYWVEWCGSYLFHSIKYNEGTFDVQDGTIGGHVSMGCIRMPIERAKWIYDNIPSGTTVVVY